MKNKKLRQGIVYSTKSDFDYEYNDDLMPLESLEPEKQKIKISLDRKQRKGKTVTLVDGFYGNIDDLNELAKELKNKCGVGGSCKDNQIIIQGNFATKIYMVLKNKGYNVKISGAI